jgi:hypothetical protein
VKSVNIKGISLGMTQDFLHYAGATGSPRASGAYIFRPKGQAQPVKTGKISVKAKKGKLVDEVLQVYGSEVTQIIRVYKGDEGYIEFDWLVGDLQS